MFCATGLPTKFPKHGHRWPSDKVGLLLQSPQLRHQDWLCNGTQASHTKNIVTHADFHPPCIYYVTGESPYGCHIAYKTERNLIFELSRSYRFTDGVAQLASCAFGPHLP